MEESRKIKSPTQTFFKMTDIMKCVGFLECSPSGKRVYLTLLFISWPNLPAMKTRNTSHFCFLKVLQLHRKVNTSPKKFSFDLKCVPIAPEGLLWTWQVFAVATKDITLAWRSWMGPKSHTLTPGIFHWLLESCIGNAHCYI